MNAIQKYIILFILFISNPVYPIVNQIRFGSTGNPLEGLTITWSSSGTNDSIRWGYTPSFLNDTASAFQREFSAKYIYDYTFPSLIADTIIHYSIFDSRTSRWLRPKTFLTAKKSQDSFSFNALGDSRTNLEDWHLISNTVAESDFTLFMGDIVERGGDNDLWDHWFDYGADFISQNLIYHTIGNHDLSYDVNATNYKNLFILPENDVGNELYYAFTYKNAVFICLNSSNPEDPVQKNWLVNTLKENNNKKWKFVWFHKPFYTSPDHAGEMDAYFSTWWKAFDDYKVDVIFNGHTHNYQRTVPINREISRNSAVGSYGECPGEGRCQIVTGGAGAPLDEAGTGWFIENSFQGLHYVNTQVYDDRVIIKTLDQYNVIIDSFQIIKDFSLSIESTSTEVCEGDPAIIMGTGAATYEWDKNIINGMAFTPSETETYTCIGTSIKGCTDTVSILINVNPKYYFNESYNICAEDSILWHGEVLKNSGIYRKNYQTSSGCDSIYELSLINSPSYLFIQNDTICKPDSLYWHHKFYSKSGTYYDSLISINDCDSIYCLNLLTQPSYHFTDKISICPGESILWNGRYLLNEGIYIDSLQTLYGCDSILELRLTNNLTYLSESENSICAGDSIYWRGAYYKAEAIYDDSLKTTDGCDSILRFQLFVNPKPEVFSISGQNSVEENNIFIYTVPENNNYYYQWEVKNGIIISSDDFSKEIRWPSAGTGQITVIAENQYGCIGDTTTLIIKIKEKLNTIQDIYENTQIKLYPNPAREYLKIVSDISINLEIYNIYGKKILTSANKTINMTGLENGIYIIKIFDLKGNLIKIAKIIK